jgi:hypothetical protein
MGNYDIFSFMKIYLKTILVVALISFLAPPPLPTEAAESSLQDGSTTQVTESSAGEDLGYGMGSVLASLFYSPLKVTYAGLGLVTGGLGYLLSAGQAEVADEIIYPAVTGNYIITPSHLKGEERVVFIGSRPPIKPPQQEYGSSPPARLP